jgi:hypothetical protein
VIECVPWRIALSEIVRVEEKWTGGLGPLRSIAGRIECLLLDMMETSQVIIARLLRCGNAHRFEDDMIK